MNNKKWATIFFVFGSILALLLASGSFTGLFSTISEPNDDVDVVYLTDSDFKLNENALKDFEQMNFFQKTIHSLSGVSLTVVGGAECSIDAVDSVADFLLPYNTVRCYQNNDHVGVAVQLFENKNGVMTQVQSEKQLTNGARGCFSIMKDIAYEMHIYYCDDTILGTCSDNDNLNYYKSGTVTYKKLNDVAQYNDYCSTDNILLERYCDVSSSVASRQYACPYGCIDGSCQTITAPPEVDDGDDDLTEDCDEWVAIECSGAKAKQQCHDTESLQYGDFKTVVDNGCEDGSIPDPVKTSFLDWVSRNYILVTSVVLGLIVLLSVIVVIVVKKK